MIQDVAKTVQMYLIPLSVAKVLSVSTHEQREVSMETARLGTGAYEIGNELWMFGGELDSLLFRMGG